MKIYSKNHCFLGLAYLGLAVAYGIRGAAQRDGFSCFMALAWAVLGLLYIRRGLNQEKAEESREADRQINEKGRQRFGKWWPVVLWAGAALAALSVVLWLVWRDAAIPAVLLFAGLAYNVVIALAMKSWTP